ncbi:MAG TPA: hypothetical protein VOB72_00555 [Candidatus Dormibacteraeota bacterium]|nr:hypothetical protein [Candidatus Dormibacteraeota bacterium]
MDLCAEQMIDKQFQLLEESLLGGPESWLPGGGAAATTTELDVRLGGSRIARRVVVRTGTVTCLPVLARCRLPIAWRAARHPERYPSLVGTLELAGVAPRRTRLTLHARYRPPAGPLGEAADRAVLHTFAEASVRAFLERVAGVLARDAMSRGPAQSEPVPQGSE